MRPSAPASQAMSNVAQPQEAWAPSAPSGCGRGLGRASTTRVSSLTTEGPYSPGLTSPHWDLIMTALELSLSSTQPAQLRKHTVLGGTCCVYGFTPLSHCQLILESSV